jgi:hypothetical protein
MSVLETSGERLESGVTDLVRASYNSNASEHAVGTAAPATTFSSCMRPMNAYVVDGIRVQTCMKACTPLATAQ